MAAPGGPCVINLSAQKQTIRGFGGSSAWHEQLTDAEADTLFTTLGLSILRVRIDPDGAWADEILNAQKAQGGAGVRFLTGPITSPSLAELMSSILAENPQACLMFYWGSHERQVRIEGAVTRLEGAEAARRLDGDGVCLARCRCGRLHHDPAS